MASREAQFNLALDALLAGRETHQAMPDNDARATLDFARRMIALRPSPRPEFQSRLKARLLTKLAEQETKEAARPDWLRSLLRRPAYGMALAALCIALVFGGLWASGVFSPAQAPFTPTVVKVEAGTNKNTYSRGETVTIVVSLQNITAETLTFSEYPPILSLMKESDHMAAYTFAAGDQTRALAPGETVTFALNWDQTDEQGNLAPSGRYYVELEDLYYQGAAVKLTPVTPAEFRIA